MATFNCVNLQHIIHIFIQHCTLSRILDSLNASQHSEEDTPVQRLLLFCPLSSTMCYLQAKKLLNIMRSPFLTIDRQLFSTQVSEEDLLKYFNRRVASYKQIRGGIIFRDSIPRNATGKLLRRHMRAWAERQSRTGESEKGQIEDSEKDRIEDFEKRRS